MSKQQDPKWEVVDELPGEKQPQAKGGWLQSLFKNKTLWIGLLVGAAAVIVFPILRVMLQNALRAWWIWLGLALYWVWRRAQRSAKK
ncbi:hypothetical protein VDG1235_1394 [Verrucomicrobiia bacterium DG1235]|nr:hypothetical protein VDG1235_1394 [Verrucomicrobiae bacterium DG1235]